MSSSLPRRVTDILATHADSDSDDDFNTPYKLKKRKPLDAKFGGAAAAAAPVAAASTQINVNNNENDGQILESTDYLPRRTAELTMYSSSDEDDEVFKSSHNLNCAILNDSFVLSPTHDLTGSTSGNSIPAKAVDVKQTESNLSFLGRFGQMGIDCSASQKTPGLDSQQAIISVNKLPPTTLHTIAERHKAIDQETPLRCAPSAAATKAVTLKCETKPETDFVTPQVRSVSFSVRGPQTANSNNNTNQKTNEFRAQKVLFQTPMTVSRAAPFPSDSMTFSLCDTINESPDIPAQPLVKQVSLPVRSKKSLENAFNEDPLPGKIEIPTGGQEPAITTTNKSSSNVLKIKDHEYVIVKKLGCGGSSSVYSARRQDTGNEYALKVVDLQGDPIVVKGYLNETKLLEKLQGNICVVALYDYQLLPQESTLYMVMEKGDCDLNKILQSYTTKMPLYNLMNILYQMLQAVNYIHQNDVIHSDLKPANFLMVNGRLKLIDFGIASNISVDSTSIIKFSQAGTFNYISPEALTDISTGNSPMRGGNQPKIKISKKSDVWSLGCILYLLLYQKTPFGHIRNIYAKINAITSPSNIEYPEIPSYYPIMLVQMAKVCLQLDPKKRPTCADLLKYPFHMVIPLQNLVLNKQ
ncbi:dual specificity protein kinase Ttk [Drosophila tropicalis]|uniref:dual specificity protein kinase Ttk n=1 Tax=Drosophila tropicalis TaxID=46794 RepID=UPI0035AB90DD